MDEFQALSGTVIAAERRRKIVERVLRHGSVTVNELAEMLGVGGNTIRRDLDALDKEGKLRRSFGGAIARESGSPRPPYVQTRAENLEEKSWIGEAALGFVPQSGTIFIGSGSTTYQLAAGLAPGQQLHVVTNCLEIALLLIVNNAAIVDFPGGRIRAEGLESDMSMSREALEELYWDVTFIGLDALDSAHGITALDRQIADEQRLAIEHGAQTVALCDSTKIGRFSYAKVGDVGMIDVLVTDVGVGSDHVEYLKARGVEVVVAGTDQRSGERASGIRKSRTNSEICPNKVEQ